jgi:Ca2+/Na+ antiporter
LDWWPLTRDSFFYLISVLTLIVVLYDGKVKWEEALIMLVLYALYVIGKNDHTNLRIAMYQVLHAMNKNAQNIDYPDEVMIMINYSSLLQLKT